MTPLRSARWTSAAEVVTANFSLIKVWLLAMVLALNDNNLAHSEGEIPVANNLKISNSRGVKLASRAASASGWWLINDGEKFGLK
jgi:hypothetical protein